MDKNDVVYGIAPMGLLFMPEARAQELAQGTEALTTAKTWGEFRRAVTKGIYEFYLPHSSHYRGPTNPAENDIERYYIPDDTPFTPNDVVLYDLLPADPEIGMSEWIPDDIQKEFGRTMKYYAMDMNVPHGNVLELDKDRMDDIVRALEAKGYRCRRDDALIEAATVIDFDPEEYPEVLYEEEED